MKTPRYQLTLVRISDIKNFRNTVGGDKTEKELHSLLVRMFFYKIV